MYQNRHRRVEGTLETWSPVALQCFDHHDDCGKQYENGDYFGRIVQVELEAITVLYGFRQLFERILLLHLGIEYFAKVADALVGGARVVVGSGVSVAGYGQRGARHRAAAMLRVLVGVLR